MTAQYRTFEAEGAVDLELAEDALCEDEDRYPDSSSTVWRCSNEPIARG
jgi:hypothetical protein